MYLPGYNSVLVPAGSEQVSAFDNPPFHTLAQPPRRRRPLLAILKLLQGGRFTVNAKGELVEIEEHQNSDVTRDGSEIPENTDSVKTDRRTELVSRFVGLDARNFYPEQKFGSRFFRTSLEDLPDTSDGFSYMYKYSSPKSRTSTANENVEVSVQRGLNKAYPHEINKQSFEDVKDSTASRLVDPLPGAAFKQSIKHHEHNRNSQTDDKGTDNVEADNRGNSTIVVAQSADGEPAKLILRPSAKAVAGAKGVAIAAPVARAVIRRGQKVTLEFDPDAVAIAGPGGRAHAHPEFTIDYIDQDSELSDEEMLKKYN